MTEAGEGADVGANASYFQEFITVLLWTLSSYLVYKYSVTASDLPRSQALPLLSGESLGTRLAPDRISLVPSPPSVGETLVRLSQRAYNDMYASCSKRWGLVRATLVCLSQGNKKGPVKRWDFESEDDYNKYQSSREAMPKLAPIFSSILGHMIQYSPVYSATWYSTLQYTQPMIQYSPVYSATWYSILQLYSANDTVLSSILSHMVQYSPVYSANDTVLSSILRQWYSTLQYSQYSPVYLAMQACTLQPFAVGMVSN